MGWIRPKVMPEVAEIPNEKEDTTHIEYASINTDVTDFPILPRTTVASALPFIPAESVRKQDGKAGAKLWIVVDNTVLDCTAYISKHPGGKAIIQGFGGQDCSWQWWTFHGKGVWDKEASSLRVGRTEGIENRHKKPKAYIRGLRTIGDEW